MSDFYALYDALADSVRSAEPAASVSFAERWAMAETAEGLGLAMATPGDSIAPRFPGGLFLCPGHIIATFFSDSARLFVSECAYSPNVIATSLWPHISIKSLTGIPSATHREMNVARNACAVKRSIFASLQILAMSSLITDDIRRLPFTVVNIGLSIRTVPAPIAARTAARA